MAALDCMGISAYLWDPLRGRRVRRTPEEEVRQWFISVLHETLRVPCHMMGSEVPLRRGDKAWRADILVYGRAAEPVMVVECKRPGVRLDAAVVEQALRYNEVLGVRYIALTNGADTRMYVRGPEGFAFLEHAPAWEDMLAGGGGAR